MKRLILIGLIISIALIAGCGKSDMKLAEFGKCLTENGVSMYGAFWCPSCERVKSQFGDSFKYVSYVECDGRDPKGQPERCLAEGIESYPTWIGEGDVRVTSTSLKLVSETYGCTLPA